MVGGEVDRMKKIVVLSDIQYPYYDPKAIKTVIDFVKHEKPDELWCVGDELDAPQPSRWNKGMRGEYNDTLQDDIDGLHDLMLDFRIALGWNKKFVIQRSNHTDRIETYINKYAPALNSLRSTKVEKLIGYDELKIQYLHGFKELLPGWVMAHGDEGRSVQTPGSTAMSLAKKLGKSVVCGHTHKLGLQHETTGLNGDTNTIFGLEVGHLMDIKQASYLTSGIANWQQGIGILVEHNRKVTPYAVPIVKGEIQLP
jgi:predicted phosphodiesterase